MVTKGERESRRALAERLRQEQEHRERRRALLIVGVCVLVVAALLGSAVFVYVKDRGESRRTAGRALTDLGVSGSAADCDPVTTVKATGNNDHVDPGTRIPYTEAPPSSGPHWGNFLQGSEIRSFYSPQDRPELERLVHSLEHGHTILWYDRTMTSGSAALQSVRSIAEKFDGETDKFIAAPWSASDGDPFPRGKHLALTHWTASKGQQSVRQYCGAASGAVVKAFMVDYPASDTTEPSAP